MRCLTRFIPRSIARLEHLLLVLCVMSACSVSVASSAPLPIVRPLSLHDAVHINTFPAYAKPVLSPDGHRLAYTVDDPARISRDTTNFGLFSPKVLLMVVDVKSGRQVIRLGEKDTRNVYPAWSPDGRWLAFISDREGSARLWVWDSKTGNEQRMSDAVLFPMGKYDLLWTPDNKHLIVRLERPESVLRVEQFSRRPPGSTENYDLLISHAPTVQGSIVPTRTSMEEMYGQYVFDIGVIDMQSGSTRVLVQNVVSGGIMTLSPDGTQLAYTSMNLQSMRTLKDRRWVYDLQVVPFAGGPSEVLAADCQIALQDPVLRWSPDGARLIYTTEISGFQPDGEGAYQVSAAQGSAPKQITSGLFTDAQWSADGKGLLLVGDPNPKALAVGAKKQFGRDTPGLWQVTLGSGQLRELTPHRWDRRITALVSSGDERTYWSGDGGHSALIVASNDPEQRDGFWKVSVSSESVQLLKEEGKHFKPIGVSPKGTVLFSAASAEQPEDIWASSIAFQGPTRRVTRSNPQLEGYVFGQTRVIRYFSAGKNQQELIGGLILPAGYKPGQRYPLIVIIYPFDNPFSQPAEVRNFSNHLSFTSATAQLFATRGYAVLFPSSPTEFGRPVASMAEGILPAVDKMIEIGIVDPNRLGITGQSYGGYSTIAMITQTTRFAAAVESAGYGNNVTRQLTVAPGTDLSSDVGVRSYGKMTGTLWERRNEYIENSPVFFLDRVQTPLLMLQGKEDTNVPYWHADEVFAGLKQLGKEVEYRRYLGEGHALFKEENMVDALIAMLRWFDTYLKVPAAALTRN